VILDLCPLRTLTQLEDKFREEDVATEEVLEVVEVVKEDVVDVADTDLDVVVAVRSCRFVEDDEANREDETVHTRTVQSCEPDIIKGNVH